MDRGLLEDIKSVLKSLIISCPRGMTIDQLNKDYRSMEGRAIPFSQLGYTKLETFLKSLTETLVVSGSGYDAKVFAIPSEKTAHIDKMVASQKNATRRRNINPHRFSVNNYKPTPLPPPPMISHSSIQHLNHQHNRMSPLMLRQQQLQHQLQQHQHQLQQHQLQQLQMQQQLQQRLHQYNTANQNACFNNVMNHPLLAKGPINTFGSIQYSIPSPQFQQVFHQYPNNIPLLNRLKNYNPNHLSNNNQLQQQQQQNSNHDQKNREQQQQQQQPILQEQQKPPNHLENVNYTNGYRNVPAEFNETTSSTYHLSDEQTIIRSIKPVEEGNSSDEEQIIDCYDRVETIRKSKDHLTPKDDSFATHASNNDTTYNSLMDISDDTVNNITEHFKALHLSSSRCNEDHNNKIYEAIPLELQQGDIIFQLDYPLNTVKFGECIPESEIPTSISKTKWFGIFITEIHNPYKFWFHFYKENHELDSLMQDIEIKYTSLSSSELQMHTSSIIPGQVCCGLFMGMWHRAEILERPENDKVKVCFVDYGTVTSVELVNVKYLLSDFSSLPSQAIRGSLADIRPVTHRWSRDATFAFLDMVSDLLLYAKATDINYKDRIIQMILTDTNKEVDFQINDALIRKGHARWYESSVPVQSTSSESQIINMPRKHFQETYPTFDMLEKGEYPSFHEMGIYLSKGIDFEEMQDQNIVPDVDGGHSIDEITKKLTTPNSSRTEITEFDNSSQEDDFGYSGEFNNDESLVEKNIVKNSSIREENSSLPPLNSNNPFLNPELLRSLVNNHSENISPKRDRNNEENHLEEKNRDESAFIKTFKVDTSNPFISESDSDRTETIFNESNEKMLSAPQIFNHNPINLITNQSMPLMPPQQIYTQIQPIFIQNQQQQQQQQIYQLAPSNQITFPSLNLNNFQNLHLFNFNSIPHSNALPAAASLPGTLNSNLNLKRAPPGFENVNPRTRNIFQ